MAANTLSDVWRTRRAAFVQNPALDRGCRCQVRLMYGNGQASISLQLQTNIAGVSNTPPRHIILYIQPSIVEASSINDGTSISPLLLQCIPTSLATLSDALTIALVLKCPGAVHYPQGLTSVSAEDASDTDFQSFVELCQATTVHIHFAKAQFDPHEKTQLHRLVDGLDGKGLKAPPLNLGREDRGRGLQEGTWQVFSPKHPGSSHDAASSVLGKRPRVASSSPVGGPLDEPPKRLAANSYTTPPPYSPTEINTSTPATRSVESNDIRPTVFTLPPYRITDPVTSSDDAQISLLANMLATVPEHVLREAITRSGHGPLLSSASGTVVVEEQHKSRVRRMSSPRLVSLVRGMFTAEVEARMKYLIESGLPLHTKDAIEKVMGDYQDQFYIHCAEAEAGIQEKVDEASLEVKMVLEDGMKEVEDLVEEHLQKLAEEYETLDGKGNLELDSLRCWFVKFARTLLVEKQSAQDIRREVIRCTSI
ncbi:hypothetical protein AUEXF2481DRAFT_36 [Aureobasidium subglaciale EXF-2481]|uniref:Uncharacterized protein n=1 Tax=Aureobasidium subglaciale (strain EXF-2481) TaxID=1043005 RepID=A0A074YQX1_AURSE|nr:uncharacterized protein AUEXF2481DRAFT_36 [Aureobasidium subglaciale EXF-2481]KAI5207939.1 hypothetical protein E4T38_03002 [Aureobasidium subglaciale]KAI5226832.1 hypothetical protein E4T40_02776 [Aureobasidium subglaciale]KAI5230212.1 hypothetical protein E4T41_02999 [Aureobasidium subglaciale]KAI5264639.1 hypothetical protein E4T46_02777 [Aureobasidium subglaciale]KER00071.1 hypothetical protein AUEXF2481DRAFT_36 [Aureobasidium subglaciale EXF-2481]